MGMECIGIGMGADAAAVCGPSGDCANGNPGGICAGAVRRALPTPTPMGCMGSCTGICMGTADEVGADAVAD